MNIHRNPLFVGGTQLKHLAIILAFISPSLSHAGVLEVKSFDVSGDCDNENTTGILTEEDNCNIIFDDLNVTAKSGTRQSKKCQFEASIRVPEGYQIAADSMALDGEFSLGSEFEDRVGLKTQYQMLGIGEPIWWMHHTGDGMDEFPQGATDSFTLKKEADPIVYAPCGQDVVFSGSLAIKASGFGSYINLDQQTARWNWAVRKCQPEDTFPHHWNSTYRSQGGQDLDAKIVFEGDHGTYTLTNGRQGTFSEVQYKNNRITGRWNFYDQQGWFDFRLFDNQLYFSGSWGKGHLGSKPLGHWSGSRS